MESENDSSDAGSKVINNQIQEYQHIQDQAQSILRLIIAGLALIGTFASSKIIGLIQIGTIPRQQYEVSTKKALPEVYKSSNLSTGGNVTLNVDFAEPNITIGVWILFLAFPLFLEIVIESIYLLRKERLRVDSTTQDVIESNRILLKEMSRSLRRIYLKFGMIGVVIIIASNFIIYSISGMAGTLLLFNLAVLLIVAIAAIFVLLLFVKFIHHLLVIPSPTIQYLQSNSENYYEWFMFSLLTIAFIVILVPQIVDYCLEIVSLAAEYDLYSRNTPIKIPKVWELLIDSLVRYFGPNVFDVKFNG